MMGTSSTSVDNPVNQIAALLSGEPEQTPAETTVEEQTQTVSELLTTDESLPQEEVLDNEEDAPEMEAADENPVEDEEEVLDTLNNLAEELEIPIEDMYALNLKLSADESITLGNLKDFYESNKNIEEERQAIKTKEEALQQDAELAAKVPTVSNELLQARAQVMSIQDQYNRTDWDALRAQDPGQYAALQNDFRTQFDLAKANEATASQTVSEHQRQARQYQVDRLFEAMPELKDDAVRQATEVAVEKYAARYGFTATDVSNIEDARLMRLLIEASKVTSAQDTAKTKKVTATPKANKSSASRPVPSSRRAALKNLTAKAKASGQIKDQQAAVRELLSNN